MKKSLIFLITIIYSVITFICLFRHELIVDEVQVWQLCKNLNFFQLINHLHNEGHPPFFYLLVMPFAKIFSNIISMQILCWFSCSVAVFLLLKYSPFKFYTKLSIIVSSGFLYFLPVVARSYSILPVLVFIAAILYLKQKQHPILYALIIIFIANTHVIMFFFSFILFCIFLYDIFKSRIKEKSYLISAFIMFLGLLSVVFILHDTTQSNKFIFFRLDSFIPTFFRIMSNLLINPFNYKNEFYDGGRTIYLSDIIGGFIVLINYLLIFITLYKSNKKIFLITFSAIAFQIFIYLFVYPYSIFVNRIFCAYLIIVFAFWIILKENGIENKYNKKINILLTIMFLITSKCGINTYMWNLKNFNQYEKEAVDLINEKTNKNVIFLCDSEIKNLVFSYYLYADNEGRNNKIYSIFRNKELKYITWDKISNQKLNYQDWSVYAMFYKQKFPKNEIYVISYNLLDDKEFQLVYSKNDFKIYKLIVKNEK